MPLGRFFLAVTRSFSASIISSTRFRSAPCPIVDSWSRLSDEFAGIAPTAAGVGMILRIPGVIGLAQGESPIPHREGVRIDQRVLDLWDSLESRSCLPHYQHPQFVDFIV
jgi:hypothetical protein